VREINVALVGFEDGVRNQRGLEAIERSARTRRRARVKGVV